MACNWPPAFAFRAGATSHHPVRHGRQIRSDFPYSFGRAHRADREQLGNSKRMLHHQRYDLLRSAQNCGDSTYELRFRHVRTREIRPVLAELRKISVQKLLSSSKIETLGHLYVAEIRALMRSLYNSCVDRKAPTPLEMRKSFGDLNLKVMVRVVAGNIIGSEDEGSGRLMRNGWLDWLGGISRPFRKTGKDIDSLLQGWLEQHKKHRTTSDRDESFMAEMMRVADEIAGKFPEYDADTITKATCQTMMLGGSDTTTVTLTWALCLLLNNQDTLRRAQEELDKHIGKERLVKESDIENLPYIQAIIKETLRIQPSAPLLPPRESVNDCTVAGYYIPAGTRLMVNIWKLHRDPQVWDDPLEFRPERFLAKHKEVDVQGKNFELLPFGGGRRICPGISFGLRFMELTLASFLHGFEIEKFQMRRSIGQALLVRPI
ncbi:UNVERIFIED_CONTAM: cytochrome [Sesamum calycinum]|uniref:Cytochrome n=1 Tax=Sesamum calycinum TaxID=2727403 RepID=A0AAW2P7M8_9LAMI